MMAIALKGGIDTHTHFDLELPNFKTSDNFQSVTKAAIAPLVTLP
ncbi:hypothetical protein [Clostridium gasigenes]|nr:hypothetical protein [Clostridium gasigenes]